MAESRYTQTTLRRVSIHPSSAETFAKRMLEIPEGMKVAIVRGIDGEEREFYSLSDPMIDPLQFAKEEQMDMKMMEAYSGYTSKDIAERKKVVVPRYSDVIGFIRFPLELAEGTKEERLTPYNYSLIYSQLVDELMNNPERWITPI